MWSKYNDAVVPKMKDRHTQTFYLKTKTEKAPNWNYSDWLSDKTSRRKIMGIIVDEKLTYMSHIEYICAKARKSTLKLSPANYVTIYKSFIRSHLQNYCAAWSHRIYHNSNLKLVESTQRRGLSLILRSFKSTPTVALEAEWGISPTDIRLQELNWTEFLKLLTKNDNVLNNRLIASFRKPKPYP